MGTASTKKFLKTSTVGAAEEAALTTSSGAADANAIPALNAGGVLDPTIINSKVISAGAGDAGKVPQLDSTGKIDTSVLPVGVGASTQSIIASEALAAGNFVNVWNNAGVANVRKADASVSGKEANGFVLAGFASSAAATVYSPGQVNTQLTGLTPGAIHYLSDVTPGAATPTLPAGTGKTVQVIGRATSATAMVFNEGLPITLA